MARTIGAKNKPKFANVDLKQLIEKFKPDMIIPIGIDFAKAMSLNYKMPGESAEVETAEDVTPPRIEII
jgi:alcohol dehydrogenase class IV